MTMTRKHFQAIADELASARPVEGSPDVKHAWQAHHTWKRICEQMASMLRTQNPNFDRERFLRACGYYED